MSDPINCNEENSKEERGSILYLVVPCYNEEEVIITSAQKMKDKMQGLINKGIISSKSKIMFVNDGSKDNTWKIIHGLCKADSIFSGICFSRNYGHQSAILAGMLTARQYADMVVTIDADFSRTLKRLMNLLNATETAVK